MLDIKFIRQNPDIVKEAAKNKKVQVDVDQILKLDEEKRQALQEFETLRAEQNQKSKGPQSPESINELKELKERVKSKEERASLLEEELKQLLWKLPNIPSDDTPVGPDESGNKVLRKVGEIESLDFTPKEHWDIGKELDLIDTERAAKVSGSRFAYIKGPLAQLEFALIQYAFSVLGDSGLIEKIATEKGIKTSYKPFIPVIPPVLIQPEAMSRMARLEPKEERYYIPSDDVYLVGSAEHTLGSMYMDETLKEEDFPIRYIGFSTAFRREAGSYGKDVKGILRVHQFDKLEMESFTLPEDGLVEQDLIVALQEYLVSSLGLPYQVVSICTGDMGGPDARQVDIETWMPGQNQYRETHTSDYMTDYQARRLNTRVKRESGDIQFVHMNDATAFAGRTMIAILENYQTKEGKILIPKALQPYMGGIKEIG